MEKAALLRMLDTYSQWLELSAAQLKQAEMMITYCSKNIKECSDQLNALG